MNKEQIIALLVAYYPEAVAYLCDAYDCSLEEMNIADVACLLAGELNKIKNPI
jgi:hypothetical protein